MSNPNTDQFDIEDIIREFSDAAPEEIPEEVTEEVTEEVAAEPVQMELPAPEPEEDPIGDEEYEMDFNLPQEFFETPEPAIFEDEVDTIRLDDVADLQEPQENLSDTQALPSLEELRAEDAPQADLEATQRIDPDAVKAADLGDTQKIPVQEPQKAEKPNRFVLHPQSNPIKELKKQLTAGPERLYYQLAEKGTGKLAAAILANLVVVLLCATVTALQAFGVVGATYLRAVIFGQILAMFVSALLGSFQLIEGAADLLRKRFSLNTLLGFSFLVCIADALLALQALRVPCCAAFCLAMTFSQLAAYHKRSTLSSRLDTMRKATSLEGTYAAKTEDVGKARWITLWAASTPAPPRRSFRAFMPWWSWRPASFWVLAPCTGRAALSSVCRFGL